MNAGAWIICTEWTTDGGSAGAFEGVRVATNDQFHFQGADAWAHRHGVKLEFSRPGKPTDNAFIESFNGRLRQECLNPNWFFFLADARETIENWRQTATNIDQRIRGRLATNPNRSKSRIFNSRNGPIIRALGW